MFRIVTVHPQELLCRYCTCRLRYVSCDVAVVRTECVHIQRAPQQHHIYRHTHTICDFNQFYELLN